MTEEDILLADAEAEARRSKDAAVRAGLCLLFKDVPEDVDLGVAMQDLAKGSDYVGSAGGGASDYVRMCKALWFWLAGGHLLLAKESAPFERPSATYEGVGRSPGASGPGPPPRRRVSW